MAQLLLSTFLALGFSLSVGKQHTHTHHTTPMHIHTHWGKVGAKATQWVGQSGKCHPQRLSPCAKWQHLVVKGCC